MLVMLLVRVIALGFYRLSLHLETKYGIV